jgi:transposase
MKSGPIWFEIFFNPKGYGKRTLRNYKQKLSARGERAIAREASNSTKYINNIKRDLNLNVSKTTESIATKSIVHTSRETKRWLEAARIEVMEWAACSLDLNPIENLWCIIVRRIYANNRQFQTNEELKTAIRETWASIDNQTVQNLVNSMPNWIFEVIQKSGGMSHY